MTCRDQVVAFSSCSPVMITGTLTNHSSLPDSEGQLQMFFLAFSTSKKPVWFFFFCFWPCQAGRTQPAISDSAKHHRITPLFICALQVFVFCDFSTKQWSSGRRQLAFASPLSITRAQTSPSLRCKDEKGGRHLVIIHSRKEVWQESWMEVNKWRRTWI